jgi:hypothetical protein
MSKYYTIFNETKNLKDWSNDPRCKVPYKLLQWRIKYNNQEPEKSLITPPQTQQNRIKMKIGDKKNRLILREIFKKEDCGVMCSFGRFDCECGNIVETKISQVYREHTKSCGCYVKELIGKRSTTHGKSKTVLYSRWCGILNRCYRVSEHQYPAYGGRGIRTCDEWKNDFDNFYNWAINNGFSPELSIDKLDDNWHYCPENCRWATIEQQLESKYNNRMILAFGEIKSVLIWTRDSRCKASIEIVKYRLWV